MTFIIKSLQTVFSAWFGADIEMWWFGIAIFILCSPLAWVRRLEPLSKFFTFSVIIIVLTVLTTYLYASDVIEE